MIFNDMFKDAVYYEGAAIPKRMPEIKAKDILFWRRGSVGFLEAIFQEVYHTILKFPPKAESGAARQAQQMNYEYCVKTMTELMKKYAMT